MAVAKILRFEFEFPQMEQETQVLLCVEYHRGDDVDSCFPRPPRQEWTIDKVAD
jgi:hypothetical protein